MESRVEPLRRDVCDMELRVGTRGGVSGATPPCVNSRARSRGPPSTTDTERLLRSPVIPRRCLGPDTTLPAPCKTFATLAPSTRNFQVTPQPPRPLLAAPVPPLWPPLPLELTAASQQLPRGDRGAPAPPPPAGPSPPRGDRGALAPPRGDRGAPPVGPVCWFHGTTSGL
eukprot:1918185-Rhodomonas_salina.1